MESTIMEFIINQIGNNGIFFALFMYLFYTNKKEGKEREVKLTEELHKSQNLLSDFAKKYDLLIDVERKISSIEEKLNK